MKSHDSEILTRIEEQLAIINKKIDALSNASPRTSERKSFSNREFGDRGDKPSYKAVCAECGESCEVPFKPAGNRPIYCSECFARQQGEDEGRPKFHKPRGRDFKKPFPGKKPFYKK